MEKLTISKTCPFCGKAYSMSFDKQAYEDGMKRRNSGSLIQDAFPTFTMSQREFLLTGICDSCWSAL